MVLHTSARALAGALALAAVVAVGACGEAEQTKTVTVTTTTPAPAADATTTARRPKRRTGSRAGGPIARRPKTTLTSCDPNVRVKAATTTCAFAENVFYEYWRSLEYGEVTDIIAFSSALGTYIPIDCEQSDPVTCRTDAGALVRFPLSAVEAYTVESAARYAASHTVSKGPHRVKEAPVAPDDDSTDCDPSYEGACLNPTASDYDCEGGSGDGPEYTGTVTVVGDDHFDLDRDGDGIGCQP
jgi:spore coat protein U-like protein